MQYINYRYMKGLSFRSSFIDRVFHDGFDTLCVVIGDTVYEYEAPFSTYEALIDAPSAGQFYGKHIKNRCPSRGAYHRDTVGFEFAGPVNANEYKDHVHFSPTDALFVPKDKDPRALQTFVVTVRVQAEDGWKALQKAISEGELVSLASE